jgi:hypothetical protein
MKTEPVAISITLSDLVICEQGTGKNSLIGCFNNYNFLRFPAAPPPFYITASLTNLDPEVKEFDVTARIEDPINGMVLASMGAHIQLREPFVLTKNTIIDVPMIGMPFVFQKPSNYLIIVLVNNNQVGKRPLTVCAVTAPSNPPV